MSTSCIHAKITISTWLKPLIMSPATAPARTILGYLQLGHTGHFLKGKTLREARNSAGKTTLENLGKKDFLCVNSQIFS